ncbi:hypothetical protein BDV19DRAFT_365658 [Aspergillus venezuelensis]
MPPLHPLFGPITSLPQSQLDKKIPRRALLINNFQPSSWFLLAASLQGLLTWLFPTVLTFLPAIAVLLYRSLNVLLQIYGLKTNPAMQDVIIKKVSAQLPDETGDFGDRPSSDNIVVVLLGAKSNHPLGILYKAFAELGSYQDGMTRDLETNREEYGFLTSTSYMSNDDATLNAASAVMTVYYFRTKAGLDRFVQSPSHRAGWDWWNKTVKQHPDLSIMHELYEIKAGSWENVYINYKPTGLATAIFPVEGGKEDGEKKWVGSIVDASKANMKSSRARLGGGLGIV